MEPETRHTIAQKMLSVILGIPPNGPHENSKLRHEQLHFLLMNVPLLSKTERIALGQLIKGNGACAHMKESAEGIIVNIGEFDNTLLDKAHRLVMYYLKKQKLSQFDP